MCRTGHQGVPNNQGTIRGSSLFQRLTVMEYGLFMQSFPRGIKSAAHEYQGERTATSIVNWAGSEVPSRIKALKSIDAVNSWAAKVFLYPCYLSSAHSFYLHPELCSLRNPPNPVHSSLPPNPRSQSSGRSSARGTKTWLSVPSKMNRDP